MEANELMSRNKRMPVIVSNEDEWLVLGGMMLQNDRLIAYAL
jgi:hypothetical protein